MSSKMSAYDLFLRGVSIGAVFLIPFVPLIVAKSMFFPFITGKNFAFRILVLVAALAWALLAIRRPEYRPRKSPILYAIIIFTVIVGLANLFGIYPYKSFWSNFERMEGYITILHMLVYFLVLVSMLNKEKLWGWFLHITLVVSVYLSLFGLAQLAGIFNINQGDIRVDATFGNAAYYAIYASMHAFFALLLAVRSRVSFHRALYIIVFILNTIMLYYTSTRGAILGFLGGLFLFAVLVAFLETGKTRKVASITVGFIVALVFVFIGIRDTSFVKDSYTLSRFSNLPSADTADSRFTIWGMAFRAMNERPLLGVGQENFNYIFNQRYESKLYSHEAWFDRAHNIYVEWFAVGGILGGLAYLSLFVVLLYSIWNRRVLKDRVLKEWSVIEKSVLTGAIAAYAVHNFFVFDNLISLIIFFAILAIVHLHYVEGYEGTKLNKVETGQDPMKLALSIGVCVLAIFIFYTANVKPILASRTLIKAMSPQGGGVSENLRLYKKALSYNTFAAPEAREQFVRFATQALPVKEISNELKQEIVNEAEREMIKQVEATPNDARYRLFLGNFYISLGQHDKAIAELKEAVALSPQKQQMYYALTAAYINKGDHKMSLETAKYAYELLTENINAVSNYILAAIFSKERVLEMELIEKHDMMNTVASDPRFLQAYISTMRYDALTNIWQARIEKEPNNAQNYMSLAATYLLSNKRQDAIKAIEGAIRVAPDAKEQGEYLISEIRAGRNPIEQ